MIVFFRLGSVFLALVGFVTSAVLLLPSGPALLMEALSRPPVLAALVLLVGGLAAAFFWAVAELIQRARWATLLFDPPSLGGSDPGDDPLTPFAHPEKAASLEEVASDECSEADRHWRRRPRDTPRRRDDRFGN